MNFFKKAFQKLFGGEVENSSAGSKSTLQGEGQNIPVSIQRDDVLRVNSTGGMQVPQEKIKRSTVSGSVSNSSGVVQGEGINLTNVVLAAAALVSASDSDKDRSHTACEQSDTNYTNDSGASCDP